MKVLEQVESYQQGETPWDLDRKVTDSSEHFKDMLISM